MAINKNFVVKNGLEVSSNLIIADAARKKVGIGSTTPRVELDVRGGIAATDLNLSGVGTIVTLQSTTGTVANISGTNVNYSGIATIGTVLASNANISGITTAGTLYVSGIATIAVGIVTFLSGTNLNYSGIGSVGSFIVSGISTFNGAIDANSTSNFQGDVTLQSNLILGDDDEIRIGALSGGDLLITHLSSSNNSLIRNKNTSGSFIIDTAPGSSIEIRNSSGGESMGIFTPNSSVELYYDNSIKLSTSGVGVTITGETKTTNLYVTGIATITTADINDGDIEVTSLRTSNLNATGVSTIQNAVVSNLNVSGISTFGSISATNISGSNLNLSGITTLGTVKVSSGIITAVSGVVTYYGDGSNLTGLSGTPPLQTVLNTGNTSTIGMSITGVSTLTILKGTDLNYSGISTITTLNGDNIKITGICTAQDFDALSDINYKTDILTIDGSLNKVDKLRGVRFNWKESGLPSYGVVAQELEQVLPELVHGNNPKTVNYNGIIGVLIEAIKELKIEVEELKKNLL